MPLDDIQSVISSKKSDFSAANKCDKNLKIDNASTTYSSKCHVKVERAYVWKDDCRAGVTDEFQNM